MKKKRKGRSRIVEAVRHPCGQVVKRTPEEKADEARQVGREARQRVFGLSVGDSVKPEAGYALGRLRLTNTISQEQINAGEEYEKVIRRYERAILVKRPISGGNIDRIGGFDDGDGTDEDYVEECNLARRAYGDARRALIDADPLAQMAVDAWVIENKAAYGLLGELRTGLNALARLYRVDGWFKRAS